MSRHEETFWREAERYHDLARQYERNIEITHPDYVTENFGCGFCYHCGWCASAVVYYEHRP